jgi:hypothetical protein
MTIEDRVRQLMDAAVADEPPPRGAPLEGTLRRRRRRPALVGAVALVLVLAAVVGLAALRGRGGTQPVAPAPTTTPPTPTTAPPTTVVSTAGWKTYTDASHNLRLRHPPDWVVRRRNQEGAVTLAPPEQARRMLATAPPFAVTVIAGGGYYLGEAPEPGMTRGRLPGGQAYLRYGGTDRARPRDVTYSIDWGRDCKGVEPYRCGPHSVLFSIFAGNPALSDRYGAVAEAIVRSAKPVTPTRPSYGDRRLPACRPGQWRLVWPREYGFAGPQRLFLSGGVQHLGGPRCHLRARLELRVERDGRLLPLPGNPAARITEGDLPEDGITREGGSWVMRGGPLFWSFYWDEWCNKGLEGPTLWLSAPNGQRLRIGDPAPAAEPSPAFRGCQDRGQPTRLAPWP